MSNKKFITAKPRMGKSTAIKKVVDLLGKENCHGFFTEEVIVDGNREGFKIITLDGQSGILASTSSSSEIRLGRYGVNLEVFGELCTSSIWNISNTTDYIIIDEVGPMQLFSEEFKSELINVLTGINPVIGTVYDGNHPWIDEFKSRMDIELIEITLENRDELPHQLIKNVMT